MSDFIPIKGYEQYYSISRTGEVMSHFYGIILKHGMVSKYFLDRIAELTNQEETE